jgi:hypothetical protein
MIHGHDASSPLVVSGQFLATVKSKTVSVDRRELAGFSSNLAVAARTVWDRDLPFYVCAVQRETAFEEPQCRMTVPAVLLLLA